MTTPQNINLLLKELGEKGVSCGDCRTCLNDHLELGVWEEYIHPILIGDILKKGLQIIAEKIRSSGYSLQTQQGMMVEQSAKFISDLIKEWMPCDTSTSLQSIIECGYETGYIHDGQFVPSEYTVETERLRSEPARNLCELLITLFTPQK